MRKAYGEWRNIMEDDFIFNFDDTSSDIESICLNCGLKKKFQTLFMTKWDLESNIKN